jgi:hypothetical protein
LPSPDFFITSPHPMAETRFRERHRPYLLGTSGKNKMFCRIYQGIT